MTGGIVVVSDTHLHAYPGAASAQGGNQRLGHIVQAMDAVLDYARAVKAAAIVHAGDLFHDRKGVRPEALHRAGEWMDRVHSVGIDLHLLVGNHDLSLDCMTHSLRGFNGRALVHAATELADVGPFRCGFTPYDEDPAKVRESCRRLSKQRVQFLFGHLGLGDPKFSNCVPAEYEVPGRIAVDDLYPDDFAQVLLGHYHLAQQVTPRVRYIGSPLQLSFGEADHPKGWLYVTPAGRVDWVENKASPRYHIVTDARVIRDLPEADFVWLRAATREDERAGAALAVDRPGMRVDRAVAPGAPARLDPAAKGKKLLESYVRAVRPDALDYEVDALVAEGIRLKEGT